MFAAHAWSIKCRRKEKLIAQFGGKLRDKRFKPNQLMFGQYLPNKNEGATVDPKSKFRELNKGVLYDGSGHTRARRRVVRRAPHACTDGRLAWHGYDPTNV